MPKIVIKCIDCGKERLDYLCNIHQPVEKYRCLKCSANRTGEKLSKKITLKCVDCGRESTLRSPSSFGGKTKENYRCRKCSTLISNRKKATDPLWLENNKKVLKILLEPEIVNKRAKSLSKRWEDPEYRKIQTDKITVRMNNPETKDKIRKSVNKLYEDPEYVKHRRDGLEKMKSDPKHTGRAKNRIGSKNSKIVKACIYCGEPRIDYPSNFTIQQHKRYVCKKCFACSEEKSGEGYWYGHHWLKGEEPKIYCELWNRSLWDRIDAAWDFKSAISGKTKFDNKNKHLDRHHVYWQEKACCIWDEDNNGYYANINLGTKAKPNIVKYYIRGDPNKFVLLTHNEHTMIRGSKKSGRDKIWWIKFFEDLIDQREKEGKKCYLSKEEYKVYKCRAKD